MGAMTVFLRFPAMFTACQQNRERVGEYGKNICGIMMLLTRKGDYDTMKPLNYSPSVMA
jgi:hypothetical protein